MFKKKKERKILMFLGLLLIMLSLLGFFSFVVLNNMIIHPFICGMALIMGSGWFLSAYIDLSRD